MRLGAEPDDRDNAGNTALHTGVKEAEARVVRLLMLSGANPLARNNAGETPQSLVQNGVKSEGRSGVRPAQLTMWRDEYVENIQEGLRGVWPEGEEEHVNTIMEYV